MRFVLAIILVALSCNVVPAAERSAPVNYVLRCLGCHLPDGHGLPESGIPDFVDRIGAFTGLPEGRAYLMHVPGVIGSSLTDKEIADVMNYIVETYAGTSTPKDYVPFTGAEVETLRAQQIGNVVHYRRLVAAKLQELGIEVADYPWP